MTGRLAARTRFLVMLAPLLALGLAAPASAQLPAGYQVQRVDSPMPLGGAAFSGGMATLGDLNGDGEDDFAVGQNAGSPGGNGQVFIFSGESGLLIDTIPAPDPGGAGTASALFGIPFVDKVPDLGSCPGRTTGQLCTNPIGAKDGVPDLLIGARGVDVGGMNDVGRAYVYDGAARALMKRIDMPASDRTALGLSSGGAWFGRVVFSPTGLPPCATNGGIGTCPTVPAAVRLGDLSGGGEPDIIVGASRYTESDATAFPESHCGQTAAATCVGAGRAYVYRGEEIAGTDPNTTLETAFRTYRNLAAQADDPNVVDVTARRELFGNAIGAIGDVGVCNAPGATAGEPCGFSGTSTTPDGRPEFVISAFRVDLPADHPDPSFVDAGVNYLVDGASGAILYTWSHPEPQAGAVFGSGIGGPPVGDLGDQGAPDMYLPAVVQSNIFKADGRGYVMSGNLAAFSSTINFARLGDPTPAVGGNFGAGYTAVGNLVTQTGKARNELLVGAGHLGEPGNGQLVNDIHFFDPLTESAIQTIADPDSSPGGRFGTDLVALGDLNEDGFLDFAAGAPAYDGPAGVAQGRIYVFRSDNTPAPAAPAPPRPGTPTPASAVTRSGRAIELAASSERIRRGRRVRLRGVLEAFASGSGCGSRQPVELQLRRPGSARYRTFARVTTDADGDFSRRLRPRRTAFYRALARETPRCLGVASAREKVTVRSRRGQLPRRGG